MNEVRLAVEKGYRILEIHEVYEYHVTKYNPESGEGGLFVDYINIFLKLKAEASGYPSWVCSPEDEELYIETFRKNEGIRLDRERFKSNAAKRVEDDDDDEDDYNEDDNFVEDEAREYGRENVEPVVSPYLKPYVY